MKLNKLFMLALVAVASMTIASCSSDDSFAPGKPYTGQDSVTFVDQENFVLSLTDSVVEVKMQRASAANELTVPIKVITADPTYFKDIPASVKFAKGETEVSFKVGLTKAMKAYVDYPLELAFDESYTNPYAVSGNIITYKAIISKDDWADWKTVSYTSWWWDDTYPATMQYSAYLNLYRIQDYCDEGSVMYIKWNGKETEDSKFVLTDDQGTTLGSSNLIFSGYVHSTDGNVYNRWITSATTLYQASTKTFNVPMYWLVYTSATSLGSFGSGYDTFTLPEE